MSLGTSQHQAQEQASLAWRYDVPASWSLFHQPLQSWKGFLCETLA
jgi:hypothetical protein